MRVLLVDDSREFLNVAESFLSNDPDICVAGKAVTGEMGIQLVQELRPDLVLMDISMPGISGLEAASRIKKMPFPPFVVMLTLYDNPEYRAAALEAGVDGYIFKSDFGTHLLPAIRQLIQGRVVATNSTDALSDNTPPAIPTSGPTRMPPVIPSNGVPVDPAQTAAAASSGASVDALIVSVGDQIYAVPQPFIREVIEIESSQLTLLENNELLPYRGVALPLIRLSHLFGITENIKRSAYALVVGYEAGSAGIVVDRIISTREIVMRPINEPLLKVPGITAATNLDDGHAILVLDPVGIITAVRRERAQISKVSPNSR